MMIQDSQAQLRPAAKLRIARITLAALMYLSVALIILLIREIESPLLGLSKSTCLDSIRFLFGFFTFIFITYQFWVEAPRLAFGPNFKASPRA